MRYLEKNVKMTISALAFMSVFSLGAITEACAETTSGCVKEGSIVNCYDSSGYSRKSGYCYNCTCSNGTCSDSSGVTFSYNPETDVVTYNSNNYSEQRYYTETEYKVDKYYGNRLYESYGYPKTGGAKTSYTSYGRDDTVITSTYMNSQLVKKTITKNGQPFDGKYGDYTVEDGIVTGYANFYGRVRYNYNDQGKIEAIASCSGKNCQPTYFHFREYDENGMMLSIYDKIDGYLSGCASGFLEWSTCKQIATVALDENGKLTSKQICDKDFANCTTEYYDEKGNVTAVYDDNNEPLAAYDYDKNGKLLATYDDQCKIESCSNGYRERNNSCVKECGEGYRDMGEWCNKIRWTPAEAAAVLTDDNNNSVTITFRK